MPNFSNINHMKTIFALITAGMFTIPLAGAAVTGTSK